MNSFHKTENRAEKKLGNKSVKFLFILTRMQHVSRTEKIKGNMSILLRIWKLKIRTKRISYSLGQGMERGPFLIINLSIWFDFF